MKIRSTLAWLGAAALGCAAAAFAQTQPNYEHDIQPIFKESCVKCHGINPKKPNDKPAGGLLLTDKEAALKGGSAGGDIMPGDAKDSLLYKVLSGPVEKPHKHEGENKAHKLIPAMPLAKRGHKWKPLPEDQIAKIKDWIDQGAK